MARSLNRVQLIGNLTRDPELRYTPQGTAVCSFGLATNRSWTTDAGEKREEADFHRIVSWNKLAELCSQLLTKGRKVYVEGRLSTRTWTAQDGTSRTTTEVVIDDMIILDSRREIQKEEVFEDKEDKVGDEAQEKVEEKAEIDAPADDGGKARSKTKKVSKEVDEDAVNPEDIPF